MTKLQQKSKNPNTQIAVFSDKGVDIIDRIHQDNGLVSLTDLWREAGSDPQKTPAKWQESEPVKRFIDTACRFLNVGNSDIIKSKRGKSGGTYAHPQVALEYAQYLDARLAVIVNENFFERVEEEKNPDLIADRAIKTYKRHGKSDDWITKRLTGKSRRNQFTSCLAAHGVEQEGFRNCTNEIYRPLFGGSSNVVRDKLGIGKKDNPRDHMDEFQLLAVQFSEALSQQTIEKGGLRGNAQCEIACSRSSKIVANAIIQNDQKPL